MQQAINDEYEELCEATRWTNKLCECCDVIHTFIKYHGYRLNLNPLFIYVLCCLFANYTAIKHGYRYYEHNCIRNQHHCQKKNHYCYAFY